MGNWLSLICFKQLNTLVGSPTTNWQNRHSSVVASGCHDDVKFRHFPSFSRWIVIDFLRYVYLHTQSKHHWGNTAGIHTRKVNVVVSSFETILNLSMTVNLKCSREGGRRFWSGGKLCRYVVLGGFSFRFPNIVKSLVIINSWKQR